MLHRDFVSPRNMPYTTEDLPACPTIFAEARIGTQHHACQHGSQSQPVPILKPVARQALCLSLDCFGGSTRAAPVSWVVSTYSIGAVADNIGCLAMSIRGGVVGRRLFVRALQSH